ncbi:unnamed protein product [Fusarium graminearum]|uniref:Uncharacterized protein n=1 Tax=Gibberella zeae TaxID=5518 RepID=A0A4E9EEN5_GIBZA|nr:unnamed protein product [Fusarium graminearum]CAG2009841.1 unnamed protein product [Fusarium graminearum]CAG2010953.1 unnamed protein product [Fusarium graminearum]
MGIYPGGKSTRIDSPRHLTLRHCRRVISTRRDTPRPTIFLANGEPVTEEIDALPPGEQKLNSFWAPGISAGPKHTISVTQTITANGERLDLEADQSFYVDAPQFSLPDGSVHSTYPPAGYSDDHRILPHVVLTDPHLPWERLGSPTAGTNMELKAQIKMLALNGTDRSAAPRNRVPWLVILSFSQDELRLPPEHLDGSSSIFRNTSDGVMKPVKQSSTMTVNMSIADLWKLSSDVTTPITSSLGPASMADSRGDFILVPPDLFTSLFSTFDSRGNRVRGTGPNTSQYQYLAHVRKINGSGMALAGVEDTAVFSIVVGNRSGPLDNTIPNTMCAHLVSIEGVEAMSYPNIAHKYVALCSLYSWNYTVLPPNTLNVPDAFESLGRTLNVLRAPEQVISPLQNSNDKIQQLVGRRLTDGYNLVKYKTQTGEATVALYRGPFTPTYVPTLEHLTKCSTSGLDLQILDKQLGIMDVTYSVAWQTGRTMALGDQAFVAALGRVRSEVHAYAAKQVKISAVKDVRDTAFRTHKDLLQDLSSMVKGLADVHLHIRDSVSDPSEPGRSRRPVFRHGGPKKRWFHKRLRRRDRPTLSFSSPVFEDKYPAAALHSARRLASSRSGDPYDETNDPQSSDWMTVLSWLVDRMFLAGVPAHCLLPDPSYLEEESLRFFHIDKNWVDALIDGALSLGNHFGTDEDRVAIKKALNDYIGRTPDGMDHRVQIPAYGFYLRSDLVTMFPDLRVEVLSNDSALKAAGQEPPAGAPLLRHEIVADGVMMAFMDRAPGSAQFSSLVFTQPAHQQRFAVARGLDTGEVKVDIRRQYTVDQSTRETDGDRHKALKQVIYTPSSSDNIFVWNSQPNQRINDLRILRLPAFADVQLQTLREMMGKQQGTNVSYFEDDASTSALFAMQLNDPIYNLTINVAASMATEALASLAPPDLGDGSPELRTINMLQAVRVKKLSAPGEEVVTATVQDDSDLNDEDGTGNYQDWDYTRPSDYAPRDGVSSYLAPHVRAMPLHEGTATTDPLLPPSTTSTSQVGSLSVNRPPGSEPGSAPRFLMRVSSNSTETHDQVILERTNLAQDLIFSIVLRQSEISQYLLMELTIDVALGSNNPTYFLMSNYTGPGAHMLTNLRFNVIPTTWYDQSHDRYFLRIRLLPRAEKGWVIATAVNELSFLLGLASINAPTGGFGMSTATVQSRARYCRNPAMEITDVNTMIVENPPVDVRVVMH